MTLIWLLQPKVNLISKKNIHIKGNSFFESPYLILVSIVGPTLVKAAGIINARVKIDTFDLSAIEVKSSDLKSFIKSLQSVLSAN